jgi:hypothetical protein
MWQQNAAFAVGEGLRTLFASLAMIFVRVILGSELAGMRSWGRQCSLRGFPYVLESDLMLLVNSRVEICAIAALERL